MDCRIVANSLKELSAEIALRIPSVSLYKTNKKIQFNAIVAGICQCTGPCTPRTCSCVSDKRTKQSKRRGGCDQYCECPLDCMARFIGCECLDGSCTTSICPCIVNNMPCSPLYCRLCSAVCKEGTCRNTVIRTLQTRPRLCAGRSTILEANIGLFTMTDVPKGAFIIEYTGEMISSIETEIRSCVYDKLEESYVFGIANDKDWSIDAKFFGNKARFINHNQNANCYAKVRVINGILRLLICAKKNIKRNSELFFDYKYNEKTCRFSWYNSNNSKPIKKRKVK